MVRPAMARSHREEMPQVAFLPCFDPAFGAHLHNVARHRDATGRAAAELAGLDRISERGTKDRSTKC